MENIACLQKNGFKFTMGASLHLFDQIAKMIEQAKANHEFSLPGITMDLFDGLDTFDTQRVSKTVKWNGHRVYVHMYYCSSYKASNEADLMRKIDRLYEQLQKGQPIKSKTDKAIVERCFTVKKTPARGIRVQCNPQAVDELKKETGGYFAVISNQFKDGTDALRAYKLRDSVEKRFDDLKNECDCRRLRVHSADRMRARLFIQFLAQILRCYILCKREDGADSWKRLQIRAKTVNDVMREMASLRYIHIDGHHPFYKRPTKHQDRLLRFFGIPTDNHLLWPSMARIRLRKRYLVRYIKLEFTLKH